MHHTRKHKKWIFFLDIDDLSRINQDQISSLNRGQKVIKHLPPKILSRSDGSYLQGRINTNKIQIIPQTKREGTLPNSLIARQ